jgi:hypothetical protein
MSTFVVRFAGDPTRGYRGTVKHVGTGEETPFSNLEELLAFIDQMNAVLPRHWDERAVEAGPVGRCVKAPHPPGPEEEGP